MALGTLRIQFRLKTLMGLVAVLGGVFWGIRTWWNWDNILIYVRMPDGTTHGIAEDWLGRKLFGRNVNSERLVGLVESRNKSAADKDVNSDSEPTVEERKVMYAAGLLARAQHPKAFELLLDLLHDPWTRMRRMAARALGELGDRRAVPHLQECLRMATDTKERGAVAFYLGKLGDLETAVPVLIDCIDDDWPSCGGLRGIQEITGVSLDDKMHEWDKARNQLLSEFLRWLPDFKKSMHVWWAEHKDDAIHDAERRRKDVLSATAR